MKNKEIKRITTMALAAAMVAGIAFSNPVTVHAEGTGDVGDILDDIFGGDKPEYDPDKDWGEKPDYGNDPSGGWWEPTPEPTPEPEPAPAPEPTPTPEPTPNPDPAPSQPDTPSQPSTPNYGNSGNTGNGGGAVNGGGSGNGNGNATVPSNPGNGNTVVVPGTPAVPVTPVTPGTPSVPATGNVIVPITDEALLAAFPTAVYVTTPEGFSFIDSLTADFNEYQVWFAGQLCNAFRIRDAKGNIVKMSAAEMINAEDGKSYVNVTIDAKTKNAAVEVSDAQASAFTRICGIDGVMINGVLTREFVDTVAN